MKYENWQYRSLLGLTLIIITLFYIAFLSQSTVQCGGKTCYLLIDDAMISMRYAQNMVTEGSLTWNIGDTVIEGYTNFLWVLFMSIIHLILPDPNVAGAGVMALALVIALANLGLIYVIFRQLATVKKITAWFILLVFNIGAYYPFVYWQLRGMETGVVILLANISLYLLYAQTQRKLIPFYFGGLLSLAYLVRMDAVLPVAIVSLFVAARRDGSLRKIIYMYAIPGAVIIAHLLWRKWYYDQWLPNTYYLKVSGVTLLERVEVGLRVLTLEGNLYLFWPVVLVAMLLYLLASHEAKKKVSPLLAIFVTQVIFSIYVGGDYAEQQVPGPNRFLLIGMTPLMLAAFYLFCNLRTQRTAVHTAVLVAGLAIIAPVSLRSIEYHSRYFENKCIILNSDLIRMRKGNYIRQITDPRAKIAGHGIGQIAYFSERYMIDLLGTNDSVVARGQPVAPFRPGHNKWNYDYSLKEKKPDIIADRWGAVEKYLKRELPGVYYKIESKNFKTIYIRRDSRYIYWERIELPLVSVE